MAVAEPLEEIVVRADLRERTTYDLPASISVLTRETIERIAPSHFEEASYLIPNLNFAGGSNRPRYFQIRGVGERSQYEGAPNPSVGFIIDDIDFSAIGGVALSWDIDQIEVLRGPQGTRYGANAIGGLIHVRSRAPDDEFGGLIRMQVGDDAMRTLGVAINGRLNDQHAARLSVYHHEADGFRENPFLGRSNTNGREESEVRLKVRSELGGATKVNTTLFYVDADNGYDAFSLLNDFTTLSDKPGRDAQRTLAGSLKVEHEFGNDFQLVSVSSLSRSDIAFSFDADWGNATSWAPFVYDFISDRQRIRENLSQEVRLLSPDDGGPVKWLIGTYASKLREDLSSIDAGVYGDPVFGEFSANTRIQSNYEATNFALFGELDWDLAQMTSLSVGLRAEYRDAAYDDSNAVSVNPDETMVGGHVRLSHELSDTFRVYGSIARGYKAGGFNLGQVPTGRRMFDAEFVTGTELGVHFKSLDDRWRIKAALFFDQRDDQQISTSDQLVSNDPSSFVFFIDNAASGDASGIELESSYDFTDYLSAYLNIGTLRTKVRTRTDALLDGREQAHAPAYTFATGLAWRTSAGWFANIDVSGKDEFFFSDSHDQKSRTYELLNASVGYQAERYRVRIWGRNLTDERYAVRGFFFGNEPPDFPNTQYVRLGDRRQIGLTFDWTF